MPLTKEELNKSEFYQRLKEQDRAQYLSELEQSRALNDSVIITEDDNKIISSDAQPLRNEAGFFWQLKTLTKIILI